jgi:hypothetical protein
MVAVLIATPVKSTPAAIQHCEQDVVIPAAAAEEEESANQEQGQLAATGLSTGDDCADESGLRADAPAFVQMHPHLDMNDYGKVHCSVTNHDMVFALVEIQRHLGGRKYTSIMRKQSDFTDFGDAVIQHPVESSKLYCPVRSAAPSALRPPPSGWTSTSTSDDRVMLTAASSAATNSSTSFPPEVERWASSRVLVFVDADQFFQAKHMQRCAELPPSFELHFFSCSVYPSGAKKPALRHVSGFCARAVDRCALHETTHDPTKDAADRLMVSRARDLHAMEFADVPFLYVTNDRLLAQELADLLSQRVAAHWKHLHLR